MIESCSKRRMVISVVGLGILTLVILILEEALTSGPINLSPTPYSANLSSGSDKAAAAIRTSAVPKQLASEKSCWLVEDYEILEECAPCTGFEINSQSPAACTETGLKEKIKCKTKGIAIRSCSTVKSIEKRNFLAFTFLMLLLFVVSSGAVRFRTSQLERRTIKNIERRLATGH